MYTIRVYYNPTCTVCQSAEKSCKCHYFQPVFKQRNISFICGLHYSAFEYPRKQKKSANGTLVWRRERDSNPCEIALKRFSRPPRYDHFDIPPYKRNYEIVLEKTLEEKTLLSEKCACFPQIQGFFTGCFRCGKEVSRPPRYDHFDIPPYKRNYEIVLEKTLEEKTLLSEKCVCFPQIRGFFADCFRYGKEVSRPPRYDRFDTSPFMKLSFDRNHQIFNCFRNSFRNVLL